MKKTKPCGRQLPHLSHDFMQHAKVFRCDGVSAPKKETEVARENWRGLYEKAIEDEYGSDFPSSELIDHIMAIAGEYAAQQLTGTLNQIADLKCQLAVAGLKHTIVALKLQLAEQNLDGMRVTQKSQHDALRSIRAVLDDDEKYDSLYCGELVITINEILKGLEL